MFPERTLIIVSWVITFAVYAFECVRTQFPLFGLESGRIYFEVSLVAPCHVSVIFNLVWAATFLTLGPMSFACEGGMTPFPIVVVLRYSWVHICTSDSGDKSSVVK